MAKTAYTVADSVGERKVQFKTYPAGLRGSAMEAFYRFVGTLKAAGAEVTDTRDEGSSMVTELLDADNQLHRVTFTDHTTEKAECPTF